VLFDVEVVLFDVWMVDFLLVIPVLQLLLVCMNVTVLHDGGVSFIAGMCGLVAGVITNVGWASGC